LQERIDDLDLIRTELENEIDQQKVKARGLLMRKELQERRIKIIIQKLEAHLKNSLGVTQEQINAIGLLNEDERQQLYDEETKIESEIQ